ncbi:MAG: pyrimidine dimer DNA glycosylase/endonuclease V [Pyrinomonadaceae bacterium]
MRIWTVHPRYLDTKGLLAAWREALLAQKVLKGETRGYRNHPQLARFKTQSNPVAAIAEYLRSIHREALSRGYKFSEEKIEPADSPEEISCTRGQLLYEWNHLKEKLKSRDAERFALFERIAEPEPHPLFKIVEGEIESWEITRDRL